MSSARALVMAVALAGLATTVACGDTEAEAKRRAVAQARVGQEGLVELLKTDDREVTGRGRGLADSVRVAYPDYPWFGGTTEDDDGRGVLKAYFDGDSREVSSGLTTDRSIARLCVQMDVALVEDRLEVGSVDVLCPDEVLDNPDFGPNLPNTFQQLDGSGKLQWVTYEELSRPGR